MGSVRQGRFAEKPARWMLDHLKKREGVEARLLDLKDYPMPFFDAPVPPAMPGRPAYEHEVVKRWTQAIAASDGFIIVSPEYNHGVSAVLKNAIDWVYPEWGRKAVTFVGYGSVGGARAIEQLRQIAVEMQIAPIRSAVHVPAAALYAHFQGQDISPHLAGLDAVAEQTIDDLLWWTRALKTAREG
ncbi:NADPH-dependent oxidoreductase [Cupriavidus lacunae]|uniref:NADPH-dependent oxidoreductase n=1 Tax=Cupriavidus lacunae TaxID=2666307 RepID=A0A370P265_9BURK|nr:NADPH-dependent oxidoreductase [Cupriavidus lacunae]